MAHVGQEGRFEAVGLFGALLGTPKLFLVAPGFGDVFEQDDQLVVVVRGIVDQAAAIASRIRSLPEVFPGVSGGDVHESRDILLGIHTRFAGRFSGEVLRADAQYPACLLVDVRKQVIDGPVGFVAQDVDAQVADRQMFDQLREMAVIALRRLVVLVDGGEFRALGVAARDAAHAAEGRAGIRPRIGAYFHGFDLQTLVAVRRDECLIERVGDFECGAAGVDLRAVFFSGKQANFVERDARTIRAEEFSCQRGAGHFAFSEIELPPSDVRCVEKLL